MSRRAGNKIYKQITKEHNNTYNSLLAALWRQLERKKAEINKNYNSNNNVFLVLFYVSVRFPCQPSSLCNLALKTQLSMSINFFK